MTDDMERLGPEVERQLDKAKGSVETPEQQKLWHELDGVAFNPDFADPERPDRVVTIRGRQVRLHHYNNFPYILSSVDDMLHMRPPRDIFAQQIYDDAEKARYQTVFAVLRHQLPAAYKRALEINAEIERRKSEGLPSQLLTEEDIYVVSQVFGAAASLARQLDPAYDLSNLRH